MFKRVLDFPVIPGLSDDERLRGTLRRSTGGSTYHKEHTNDKGQTFPWNFCWNQSTTNETTRGREALSEASARPDPGEFTQTNHMLTFGCHKCTKDSPSALDALATPERQTAWVAAAPNDVGGVGLRGGSASQNYCRRAMNLKARNTPTHFCMMEGIGGATFIRPHSS